MSVIGLIAFLMPVVWSSGPAAAASAPVASFRYVSFRGDGIGGRSENTYTSADATITESGTAGGFTFRVSTSTDFWNAEFGAQNGTRLHPGWFPNARELADSNHPAVNVTGLGHGCNQTFGGLVIFSIQFDTNGNLAELSMGFLQRCDSPTAAPLVGWFTYNAPSSAPVTLVSQDPSVVQGEPVTLGVSIATNGTPPTGSVTFVDGTTTLGKVSVDWLGLAHITVATLSAGTHAIHADYSGDATHPPGSSNTISQLVSAATTYFWFASRAGDSIGDGALASFIAPNVSITGGTHSISVSTGPPYWFVLLSPPSGTTFEAGTTYAATRFGDTTNAQLDFFGDGRGCNNSSGTLVIHRIQTDSSGNLTALNASFVQHCENPAVPPAAGTLLLNG